MGYNKARAEREWLAWKNAEEQQLRELGVDEDTIQRLHTYDWEAFKADRNYRRWEVVDSDFLSEQPMPEEPQMISTPIGLLDSLQDQQLRDILLQESETTLQILLYKTLGFTGKEIARKLGMSEKAVNLRVSRVRKKLKNF